MKSGFYWGVAAAGFFAVAAGMAGWSPAPGGAARAQAPASETRGWDGWISLSSPQGASPAYSVTYAGAATDVGAGMYDLVGWAWSSNIGWVSFSSRNTPDAPRAYGVKLDKKNDNCRPQAGLSLTCALVDYAWSPNIGWIKFNAFSYGREGYPENPQEPARQQQNKTLTGWARACAGTERGDCNSASRTD